MNKTFIFYSLFFIPLLLLVTFFVWQNFQRQNLPKIQQPTAIQKGEVKAQIEFLKEKSPERLAFKVILDTHSVDLGSYDFPKSVVLKDESGKEYLPIKTEVAGAGHHREAEVEFPAIESNKFIILVRNLFGQPEEKFEFRR